MTGLAAPTRHRRRRTGRRILIAFLVLIGVLVAADRIGVQIAERIAADTLQDSQHLAHRPEVHIDGFPFLTQLASGHFDQIRASTSDVVVGSGPRSPRIDELDVRLRDVDVARNFSRATAATLRATGTIGYPELSRALGIPVRYAGGGRISISASTRVAGQRVSGSVSAAPRVIDQALRFAQPRVHVAGAAVPDRASSALAAALGAPLSVRGLPFGLRVEDVRACAGGISLTLHASSLTFRR